MMYSIYARTEIERNYDVYCDTFDYCDNIADDYLFAQAFVGVVEQEYFVMRELIDSAYNVIHVLQKIAPQSVIDCLLRIVKHLEDNVYSVNDDEIVI